MYCDYRDATRSEELLAFHLWLCWLVCCSQLAFACPTLLLRWRRLSGWSQSCCGYLYVCPLAAVKLPSANFSNHLCERPETTVGWQMETLLGAWMTSRLKKWDAWCPKTTANFWVCTMNCQCSSPKSTFFEDEGCQIPTNWHCFCSYMVQAHGSEKQVHNYNICKKWDFTWGLCGGILSIQYLL